MKENLVVLLAIGIWLRAYDAVPIPQRVLALAVLFAVAGVMSCIS